MPFKITNQKPAILYNDPFSVLPVIDATTDAQTYEGEMSDHIKKNYVDPLYEPINSNQTVSIQDTSNNKDIDADSVLHAVKHLWTSPTLDVTLQDEMSDIYRQSIQYHAQNDWYLEEQLVVEALTRMKLPLPSATGKRIVKYSANIDVIPTAKAFLAQPDDQGAMNWFANISAYIHDRPFNNFLLMTVQTADVWDEIKQHVKNQIMLLQANHTIARQVNKLFADFDKIDLSKDLSAGLFMPNGGASNAIEMSELSFTRILMNALSQYEKHQTQQASFTVQPSNLSQVYVPENIIVINLENYAHAQPADIKKDWDDHEKALNAKKNMNFISNKKLMTMKSVTQNTMTGGKSNSVDAQNEKLGRVAVKPFAGKPIPAKAMLSIMKKVIESQVTSKQTENTYKKQSTTYMRPNRRKPEDINLPGKLVTTKYRPDIHIYLDTSGSISESQYRDAVTNLIMLTKKIDCNLYITSFSHYVSQTTLLKTKGRSTNHIYKQFLSIPKVTGGTDFAQVWKKIELIDESNKRNARSYQLNFIITDFGYSVSRDQRWRSDQAAVKNTFYVPMSLDKRRWKDMRDWAEAFKNQMQKAGDRNIRKRMLI